VGTSTKWAGMAALQMLNEGYDFSDIPFGSAKHLHIVNEAKNGFEDRAKYYADMNFVKVPVQQLLSKEYGDKRRALIDLDKSEHIKLVKSVIQDRIYDRC
jgi:gamma-glutamyltranspeptidase/glutathione hydrolase